MIDLTSLKEQLALLGHSLPDSQILSILHDMNIEVEGTDAQKGPPSQPEVQLPASSSKYAHLVNAPLVLPPQLPTLLEEEDEVLTGPPTVESSNTLDTYKTSLGGTWSAAATSSSCVALPNSQGHAAAPLSIQRLSQPAPVTITSAPAAAPAAATNNVLGSSQQAQHVTMSIRPDNAYSHNTLLGATAPFTATDAAKAAPSIDTGVWLGNTATNTALAAPTTLLGRGTTGTLLPTTSNATLTHLNNLYNTALLSVSGSAPTAAAPAGSVPPPYQAGAPASATTATGASAMPAAAFTTTAATVTGAAAWSNAATATAASAGASAGAGLASGPRYGNTATNYASAAGRQSTGSVEDEEDDDRVQDILGRYYGRHTSSSQSECLSTEPSLTHLGGKADAACVMGVTDRAAYLHPGPGSKFRQGSHAGGKCDYDSGNTHWPGSDAMFTRDQVQKATAVNHLGASSQLQATEYVNEATYMPAGSGKPRSASLLHAAVNQGAAAGGKARTKYDWKDALRTDADDQRPAQHHSQANTNQRPSNNGASSRPSRAGRSTAATGGARRKTDVVSRYAQLQAGWQQDRFLNSMGGGSSSKTAAVHRNRSTSVASGRKPLNFHQYFKAMHAAEAAERDMMSKMTRAYTTDSLKPAAAGPSKQRR